MSKTTTKKFIDLCADLFSNEVFFGWSEGWLLIGATMAAIGTLIYRSIKESQAVEIVAKNTNVTVNGDSVSVESFSTSNVGSEVVKPVTELVKALASAPSTIALIALAVIFLWRPEIEPSAECKTAIEAAAKPTVKQGQSAAGT